MQVLVIYVICYHWKRNYMLELWVFFFDIQLARYIECLMTKIISIFNDQDQKWAKID